MKHHTIDSIVSRRKSLKVHSSHLIPQLQGRSRIQSLVRGRELNIDMIDTWIQMARAGALLNQEHKLDILQLIAAKTGVTLNKSLVMPYMCLLYVPQVEDLSQRLKKGDSFFVLTGEVRQYQMNQSLPNPLKFNTQPPASGLVQSQKSHKGTEQSEPPEQQSPYFTIQEFEYNNPTYELSTDHPEFSALGKIFGQKWDRFTPCKIIAKNTVIVWIKDIEREAEFIYSDGLSQDEKLQLVSYFPVMRLLGKKLHNLVSNFKLKHFNFKEAIYKKGEVPQSVFFVIEGQVSFELVLVDDEPGTTKRGVTVATSTILPNNYFGEEEIIFKSTTRTHTAKVITEKCTVLELTKDKFQKLLENSDFNQLVLKSAKLKELQRLKNLEKAKQILIRNSIVGIQKGEPLSEQDLKNHTVNMKPQSKRKFSTLRSSNNKVKIMHGNIIRDVPQVKAKFNFSMLKVNPDHYNATKDKYRQYFVKPNEIQGKKPRNFKQLWNVLNLQNVLSQNDIDLTSAEGRKYFESHRRLQNQLIQTKSVRPKTTSSNYRTKIQYIAYLQQFNN